MSNAWEDRMAEMAESNPILNAVEDSNRRARLANGMFSGLLILAGIAIVGWLFWTRV